MNAEALRLKRLFRRRYSFARESDIKQLLRLWEKWQVMDYLVEKTVLECEIAKLTMEPDRRHSDMVEGPLLGKGCKVRGEQ